MPPRTPILDEQRLAKTQEGEDFQSAFNRISEGFPSRSLEGFPFQNIQQALPFIQQAKRGQAEDRGIAARGAFTATGDLQSFIESGGDPRNAAILENLIQSRVDTKEFAAFLKTPNVKTAGKLNAQELNAAMRFLSGLEEQSDQQTIAGLMQMLQITRNPQDRGLIEGQLKSLGMDTSILKLQDDRFKQQQQKEAVESLMGVGRDPTSTLSDIVSATTRAMLDGVPGDLAKQAGGLTEVAQAIFGAGRNILRPNEGVAAVSKNQFENVYIQTGMFNQIPGRSPKANDDKDPDNWTAADREEIKTEVGRFILNSIRGQNDQANQIMGLIEEGQDPSFLIPTIKASNINSVLKNLMIDAIGTNTIKKIGFAPEIPVLQNNIVDFNQQAAQSILNV